MISQRYALPDRVESFRPRKRFDLRSSLQPPAVLTQRMKVYRSLSISVSQSVLVHLMLVVALVGVAGTLYLAQASDASVLQFSIDQLQATRTQLDGQNASLQATATSLQSLQRVDAIAVNELHMTPLDFSHAVWVRPVVPLVTPQSIPHFDSHIAIQQSQPSGWMGRFVQFVKTSL